MIVKQTLVISITRNMLLYLLLFGAVVSVLSEDVQGFINEAGMDSIGEITLNDETFLMHIVPSGMTSKKFQKIYKPQLLDIFREDDENYKKFTGYMERGYTLKGLTFNIYDDNMREPTLALYRMICDIDPTSFLKVKEWAKQNINEHMFDYAERLCSLFGPRSSDFKNKLGEPPFLFKPYFYVNAETIIKAQKIKNNIGHWNYQDAKVNQYYRTDNIISINTNYSGWNKPQEGCGEKVDYFTEDIGLNTYYYGVHLLHPYWMSNNELDEMNPRYSEHYHFSHKQLYTRYQLEIESMRQRKVTRREICDDPFDSYLIYENGLPFPVRSNIKGDWNEDKAKLKAIDIGIKECISRGFLVMEDGSKQVNLTENNYIGLISKMIRANYDNTETSKIVRSLYGYGRNGYPKDSYNPSPSLLHQPETTLRDPAFMYLIENLLKYYSEFANTLEPLDMSQYEADDYEIISTNITKLTTFFDYYQFIIDRATQSDNFTTIIFTARQRRLNHLPWSVDINVRSKIKLGVLVRIFLGPPCANEECWDHYNKFYLLDAFPRVLKPGDNLVHWTPESSDMITSDHYFNLEDHASEEKENHYNMLKFPKNLLLPKGSEEGLNMTLFIMVASNDEMRENRGATYDVRPLLFPFHRQAKNFKYQANNYGFHNITIFHKKRPVDRSGYFSTHLY